MTLFGGLGGVGGLGGERRAPRKSEECWQDLARFAPCSLTKKYRFIRNAPLVSDRKIQI